LLVVDSLHLGGAERHVVDLAIALRRKGHEVAVACSVAGELSGPLQESGIPVRPLLDRLVKRRFSVAFARELRKLVKEGGFGLVHAHVYASATAASVATLGLNVPLVITEHSEGSWRTWRTRQVSRWVYRRAKHVVAVSSSIRRLLLQEYGVAPERVIVVPNAVAASSDTTPSEPPSLPGEWREGPVVGVVAHLKPEKGLNTFLEAAARVSPLLPNVRFLVVGDGPLRGELEASTEHLGLNQRVRFLGFRSDARALVELLDVLVVPSLSEGAPLVILEAMAAGIPVVASAVGGIPDQIRHEREGLLVPPGNSAALGDALFGLLQDLAHARHLGEAGRQRWASEFSYATMVRRVEAVYRSALGRPAVQAATPEELELQTELQTTFGDES
jgi:glycosyltransferase involved in cell wall biosynthesis